MGFSKSIVVVLFGVVLTSNSILVAQDHRTEKDAEKYNGHFEGLGPQQGGGKAQPFFQIDPKVRKVLESHAKDAASSAENLISKVTGTPGLNPSDLHAQSKTEAKDKEHIADMTLLLAKGVPSEVEGAVAGRLSVEAEKAGQKTLEEIALIELMEKIRTGVVSPAVMSLLEQVSDKPKVEKLKKTFEAYLQSRLTAKLSKLQKGACFPVDPKEFNDALEAKANVIQEAVMPDFIQLKAIQNFDGFSGLHLDPKKVLEDKSVAETVTAPLREMVKKAVKESYASMIGKCADPHLPIASMGGQPKGSLNMNPVADLLKSDKEKEEAESQKVFGQIGSSDDRESNRGFKFIRSPQYGESNPSNNGNSAPGGSSGEHEEGRSHKSPPQPRGGIPQSKPQTHSEIPHAPKLKFR